MAFSPHNKADVVDAASMLSWRISFWDDFRIFLVLGVSDGFCDRYKSCYLATDHDRP